VSRRDIYSDIAAIGNPLPVPPDPDSDVPEDGYRHECWQVQQAREEEIEYLRVNAEEGGIDPLLGALSAARRAKELAEERIRQLVAYGREFIQPRPYTLADLAEAAGMSISGVRTAYGHPDVDAVADATGAKPRDWRAADPHDVKAP
jgi:hypothetical protein